MPLSTRKRRTLACEDCRRARCRCEYDGQNTGCHRCQRLRIKCTLSKSQPSEPSSPSPGLQVDLHGIHEKLEKHDKFLGSIFDEVKKLREQVLGDSSIPKPRARRRSSMSSHQDDWYDHVEQGADRGFHMAPINVLRHNFSVESDRPNLIKPPDVIQLGILTLEDSRRLSQLFFQRVGPWIQVDSWNEILPTTDLREDYPFLFSVCCLQGARLDEDFCNSTGHHFLYDHVRITMQRLFLSSPLPLESLYAFLLMSMANTSRTSSEFTDSWMLSGFTAQQAILNINFGAIMTKLKSGRAGILEKSQLRLWNSVCLCHLQFAIGTGRPSMIPDRYVQQGRGILNSFEASLGDAFEVGAIMLITISEKLLVDSVFKSYVEVEARLQSWKRKWQHLFTMELERSQDRRLQTIGILYNFCQLIIARRALAEDMQINESTSSSDPAMTPQAVLEIADNSRSTATNSGQRGIILKWEAMMRASSFEILNTFQTMTKETVEALPEFYYLCITWAMVVLSRFMKQPYADYDDQVIGDTLQKALSHGQNSSAKTMRMFDVPILKLRQLFEPQRKELSVHAEENYIDWQTDELEIAFREIVEGYE